MDKYVRKPDSYSGEVLDEFTDWLARFNVIAKANNWDYLCRNQARYSIAKVADKKAEAGDKAEADDHKVAPENPGPVVANQVYEGLGEPANASYEVLTKALAKTLGTGEKSMVWRLQLRSLKRSPGESLDAFVFRLRKLANKAYPDLRDEEKESIIKEQLF